MLPARIETERLVLRPWEPDDAPKLHAAITASTEHLRPWMEWIAHEPLTVDERRALIESWRTESAAGGDLTYAVFAGAEVVGGCGLHHRVGPGGIEVGYWVHVDHCRRGYATELSRGLTTAAFAVEGIDRVEIHTDKANEISARVPERLGYVRGRERADKVVAPAEAGIDVTWTMTRSDWLTLNQQ